MTSNKFLYFKNMNFIKLLNPDDALPYIPFHEKGTFKLKDNEISIDRNNLRQVCSEFSLPHSMLASKIQNVQFLKSLEGLKVCFFDIETSPTLDWELGYLVGDLFPKPTKFENPEELIKAMLQHDVICGFNIQRFDLRWLVRRFPQHFDTIRYSKTFDIVVVPNKLCLDFYFWLQLANPYSKYHSLSELIKIVSPEEERVDLSNKNERCKQDILVLQKYFPTVKQLFEALGEIINLDLMVLQTLSQQKLRRWLFYQTLINQNLLPYKFNNIMMKRNPSSIKFIRKGFYKNIYFYDVSGAFSTTAVNTDIGLCYPSDFSNYHKLMMEMKEKYPDLKATFKVCSLGLIGDMLDRQNYWRNEKIYFDIVSSFAKRMRTLIRKYKRILVFSNIDSLALKEEKDVKLEGYDVALKYVFKYVNFYTINQLIGYDTITNSVILKKFQHPLRIELFNYLDNLITESFRKDWKILKNPEKLAKGIEKLPLKYFKRVVYKSSESEPCRDIEIWNIFPKLPKGFSELFLGRRDWVIDMKKIHWDKYKKMSASYLRKYKIKGG